MIESSESVLVSVSEPIAISLIAGRYLLFDADVVTYLRKAHHICGVLIGSITQVPQQNTFLGLPVELLPEEARLLVDKEVAYIIDDTAWHQDFHRTFKGADRQNYLESLRSEGLKARNAAQKLARKKTEYAIAKKAARPARAATDHASGARVGSKLLDEPADEISIHPDDSTETSFVSEERLITSSSVAFNSSEPYKITPTTTYSPSSLPKSHKEQPDPRVPSSYALFAHLHSKAYFVMPGLRFGCDYNVYPGDPLRFHSHFLATSYGWEQDIPLLDLIGGGRLGTGVKKGFLIGGQDKTSVSHKVRTFTIEWGGM